MTEHTIGIDISKTHLDAFRLEDQAARPRAGHEREECIRCISRQGCAHPRSPKTKNPPQWHACKDPGRGRPRPWRTPQPAAGPDMRTPAASEAISEAGIRTRETPQARHLSRTAAQPSPSHAWNRRSDCRS